MSSSFELPITGSNSINLDFDNYSEYMIIGATTHNSSNRCRIIFYFNKTMITNIVGTDTNNLFNFITGGVGKYGSLPEQYGLSITFKYSDNQSYIGYDIRKMEYYINGSTHAGAYAYLLKR
jgi:hypothetical protein